MPEKYEPYGKISMKNDFYYALATDICDMSHEEAMRANPIALHYAYEANKYSSEDGMTLTDSDGFKYFYDKTKGLTSNKIYVTALVGVDNVDFVATSKCFDDEPGARLVLSEISNYSKKGISPVKVLQFYGNCTNEKQVKANKDFLATCGGDIDKALKLLSEVGRSTDKAKKLIKEDDGRSTISNASSVSTGRRRRGSSSSIEF
jgi:hypothetical protein